MKRPIEVIFGMVTNKRLIKIHARKSPTWNVLFSYNLIIYQNEPACVYIVKLGFNGKTTGHKNYQEVLIRTLGYIINR